MPIAFIKQATGIKLTNLHWWRSQDEGYRWKWDKWVFCARTEDVTSHFVLTLQVFSSLRSQPLGPWKSCLPLCPPSPWCPLVHPTLLRLFLSFSKAPFLCHLFWASIWPFWLMASAGHHLFLKPAFIILPLLVSLAEFTLPEDGLPWAVSPWLGHGSCADTGCILILSDFCKFSNLKHP